MAHIDTYVRLLCMENGNKNKYMCMYAYISTHIHEFQLFFKKETKIIKQLIKMVTFRADEK